MKTILLFGAGKSATVLIDYLVSEAGPNHWHTLIADTDKALILSKTKNASSTEAIEADINNSEQRASLISRADLVISMMPPALHILIARDCLRLSKHLLTASYVDDALRELEPELKEKGILFLCEMGLDPGIDHMSAMKMIHAIKASGGHIRSFKSHCGGLVAPESDDNPWHYKISWNPRNIVMAGKAGAVYRANGQTVRESYELLFSAERGVKVNEEIGFLSWYPNRDSLPYIGLYDLGETDTFLRTTLRHPEFMLGWNDIVSLKLTDEEKAYETEGMSLAAFFQSHLDKLDFREWLSEKPDEIHRALIMKQLDCLGWLDAETHINKGLCSAMEVLQFAMEKNLALQPDDKDMIVMLHEFEYETGGNSMRAESTLVVKGNDRFHTAMAKTVGLPLGIAAKLILNGRIELSGLHIPVSPEIYSLVLPELEEWGVRFVERENHL
ncbi:MAG: saccharopine dehydrogenase NADP-binding domain-containing protein [Chitinophagaceae bacterium]|nr:saccharopine dehydrogenase NADP-binding domain-containing protein [Chitinophagaceae bacterium]